MTNDQPSSVTFGRDDYPTPILIKVGCVAARILIIYDYQ